MHLGHISYCTFTYIDHSNSQSNIHHNHRTPYSRLRTLARVGVSVLTSLNNINPSSFQHEYIFLFITKSSNLPMESLSIIAPAIHIHNRKHISHSTSCLKTYRTTPRQTISPQRHHANRTAPHFGGQSENPTETRGVYGYHVRHT